MFKISKITLFPFLKQGGSFSLFLQQKHKVWARIWSNKARGKGREGREGPWGVGRIGGFAGALILGSWSWSICPSVPTPPVMTLLQTLLELFSMLIPTAVVGILCKNWELPVIRFNWALIKSFNVESKFFPTTQKSFLTWPKNFSSGIQNHF